MTSTFQRRSQELYDRRALAAGNPQFADADLGRCQRKRRFRIPAARQEFVEEIGKVLDRLCFSERQHGLPLLRRDDREFWTSSLTSSAPAVSLKRREGEA